MVSLNTYRHLRRNTLAQRVFFLLATLVGVVICLELIALPLVRIVFHDTLIAQIQEHSHWFEWLLIVDPSVNSTQLYRDTEYRVYVFNPLLSLAPVVLAAGFVFAAFLTAFLPRSIGLVRQNLEREISQALYMLAQQQFSVAGAEEGAQLIRQRLLTVSEDQLHALEVEFGLPYNDLRLLQRALLWLHGKRARILYLGAALRLYMRNHFTIEYEQAVLGSIYVGAAVLIIVIGLRGLQFIPKERPSLVLFAISLEFVLLIAYAVTLIFSRASEETQSQTNLTQMLIAGNEASSSLYGVDYAEKLLRMFIALPAPPSAQKSDGEPILPQSN